MKYYITPTGQPEREVTKDEYLAATKHETWGFPSHLIPAVFVNGAMRGRLDEDDQEECLLRESINSSPDDMLPTIEESLRRDIESIVDEAERTKKTKMVERLLQARRER